MKQTVERVLNVAIAFAIIFFLYGLVKIIIGLSSGQERVQAVGTTVVVAAVLFSLLWAAATLRSKD